jgi:hypothetical protein
VFRHRFDPSSLVAGILFLGIAARYLIEGFGGQHVSYLGAVPAVLATVVAIMLLRVVFRSRRER